MAFALPGIVVQTRPASRILWSSRFYQQRAQRGFVQRFLNTCFAHL